LCISPICFKTSYLQGDRQNYLNVVGTSYSANGGFATILMANFNQGGKILTQIKVPNKIDKPRLKIKVPCALKE